MAANSGVEEFSMETMTEKHRESIKELRKACEESGKVSEWLSEKDETLYRFLIARQFQVSNSLEMLINTSAWYENYNPMQYVDVETRAPLATLVEHQRKKGVWLPGKDKLGRPIVVGFAARHDKNFPSFEEKVAHAVGAIKSAELRTGDWGYFTVICDLTGLGWSNVEYGFVRAMIDTLQMYFPERLGAFLLINSGWLFSIVWKAIRGWLDPRTASKVQVLSGDGKAELLELIDKENLPASFGGTLDDKELFKVPKDAPKKK